MQNNKSNFLIYGKLILVALFWGGTFISTRIVAQNFGPFTGAGLRYSVALIFLIPLAFRQNRNFFKEGLKKIPLMAALGLTGIFGYNFFFFKGLKSIPASRGALLVSLNPLFVMLLSALVYKEKITKLKLLGILVSLTGLVIVVSRGQIGSIFSSFQVGDLFMLGCPATWAVYTIIARPALQHTTPLQATTWASLTGLSFLLLFSLSEPAMPKITLEIGASLLYLGLIGTVVGFVWYYDGIQKIGATRTAIFTNLVPVFAILLSVLLLHEEVIWFTWLGGILVLSGVWITNSQQIKTN
jgi:drug/metabolite transporter (DMT)-like permease